MTQETRYGAPAVLLGAAGLGAEVEPSNGAVLPAGEEGVGLPRYGHHLGQGVSVLAIMLAS